MLSVTKFVSAASVVFMLCSASSAVSATLEMTPDQVDKLGIRTAPVDLAVTQTATSILGSVMPALNARVPVPAPYSGTVVGVEVLEGESVEAGDALVILASRDVRDARAQLQNVAAQHRAAALAADRARQLFEEGIVSSARAEEASAHATGTAAELAAIREILSQTKIVEGSTDMYRLVAPVSGRVAQIEVLPGRMIEEMQPAIFLDTGDELWIEARLPASEVGKVAAGDSVLLEGLDIRGRVVAAGASIDPHTRSAVLRAVVPTDARLVSGGTVRISVVQHAAPDALNVPRNAVVRLDEGFAVFVRQADGFDVIPVTVIATGQREITLAGAIEASASVAISGLSELKTLALED